MHKPFVHPLLKPIGFRRDGRAIYPIAGADGRTAGNPVLSRLIEQRQAQIEFMDQTLSAVESEDRDLVDAEKRNLDVARDRIKELDEQIKPLQEFEELRSAHRSNAPAPRAQSFGSPVAQTQARGHEYRSMGEVMADGWLAKTKGDEEAKARLESIGRGIEDGKLAVVDTSRARDVDSSYVSTLSSEARADAPHITTTEIPGILPVSVVGSVISDLDANRPFLNSIGVKDMSGIKGKTFSRPVVTTHVTVGTQSAEKAELDDGQLIIGDVDFTKSTEGGWANVSRQAIDWSSPAMWDALLKDFMDVYAIHTENKAADAFVTAVQAGTAAVATVAAVGTTPDIGELITGLYAGAVQVYTGSSRLPNHVWMSLDMWATIGVAADKIRATTAGGGGSNGDIGNLQNGGVLTLPRTVVPSFPAATLIIGRTDRVEAYEERLGFLSAVQPKVLGVELAYGGYFASGVIDADAFAELTFT